MDNTITFFYNPYTYFESYKNVLHKVRCYYKKSDIFIYMDKNRNDLQKYNTISFDYNCNLVVRESEVFYIDRKDTTNNNIPKMVELLNRIKNTCENTSSKWVLILEDDVLIKRKINYFPNSDCGINRDDAGFLGGGSIFKREKFLDSLKNTDIVDVMNNDHTASWAGDVMLKYIFLNNNSTYEKWLELAEPGYNDNGDYAIYHGYKELHKLG